jgi:mannose-1-phosphate guanylyltransferase
MENNQPPTSFNWGVEVVCGRCHEKSTQTVPEIFDEKSLFEMTVERNRNIVDKVMVVGNIDNCHLSKKVLEKSIYRVHRYQSTPRNTAAATAAAFASHPEDIITHQTILMKCIV